MTATAILDGMISKRFALSVFAQGNGEEPLRLIIDPDTTPADNAEVQKVKKAVSLAGRELWPTTDDYDFDDCLGDLIERRPWPSLLPLFDKYVRKLPESQQNPRGINEAVLNRAEVIFGSPYVNFFDECLRLLSFSTNVDWKLAKKNENLPISPKEILGGESPEDVMHQADFPPIIHSALIENLRSSICAMAITDAMIRGKKHDNWRVERMLKTWYESKIFHTIVSVALLDEPEEKSVLLKKGYKVPTVDEMILEGLQAKELFTRAINANIKAINP